MTEPLLHVHEERGSVSIVVVAVLSALLVLTLGAADVARVFGAAARAQMAADASALAAAHALAIVEDGPTPAELAEEYAVRNDATLEACACEPGSFEATVTVRLRVGGLYLFPGDRSVVASARAEVDVPAP